MRMHDEMHLNIQTFSSHLTDNAGPPWQKSVCAVCRNNRGLTVRITTHNYSVRNSTVLIASIINSLFIWRLLTSRTISRTTAFWVRNTTLTVAALIWGTKPAGIHQEGLWKTSITAGSSQVTSGKQVSSLSVVTSLWCNRPYLRASKPKVTHISLACLMQQVKYLPHQSIPARGKERGGGGRAFVFFYS